eukprot:GHVQ01036667.1.p1 GENE.GHVQ01036667.1~~GHVQ01036667.1.p1  ORF type:complete len:273 (+),score=15.16 GHVQ01036667.1:32-820(+)
MTALAVCPPSVGSPTLYQYVDAYPGWSSHVNCITAIPGKPACTAPELAMDDYKHPFILNMANAYHGKAERVGTLAEAYSTVQGEMAMGIYKPRCFIVENLEKKRGEAQTSIAPAGRWKRRASKLFQQFNSYFASRRGATEKTCTGGGDVEEDMKCVDINRSVATNTFFPHVTKCLELFCNGPCMSNGTSSACKCTEHVPMRGDSCQVRSRCADYQLPLGVRCVDTYEGEVIEHELAHIGVKVKTVNGKTTVTTYCMLYMQMS